MGASEPPRPDRSAPPFGDRLGFSVVYSTPALVGLLVYALVVLGLALIGFAMWVVRDEAPRWTLRVRRPGWALILALAAFVAAYVVNAMSFDMNAAVRDHVGQRVECEQVGELEVEARMRDLYACVGDTADRVRLGCFVRADDGVMDVTRRVEEPGAFPGRAPDC